jgi:tRNA (pseudouridine54-N1)-methyltransferase
MEKKVSNVLSLKNKSFNNIGEIENREFVLYSRKGRTDSQFKSLYKAGRLDILHECIVTSFFLSHGIRRNVLFHAFLCGPPSPPMHIKIEGENLYNVQTNIEKWTEIIKKILSGSIHPGVSAGRTSFENFIKMKSNKSSIYVLEEGGEDIFDMDFDENPVFVLGDHVGLPKKTEKFVLRFGKKISLGKQPYLAASCISTINYILDRIHQLK